MTTKDFQCKLKREILKLKIKEELENDPHKKKEIRERTDLRSALLNNIERRCGQGAECAIKGGD